MVPREIRAATLLALLGSCHPQGSKVPWDSGPGELRVTHAQVRTLNTDYDRQNSSVLVREIQGSRRAALDYAAYHANFMIAEPPPEGLVEEPGAKPDTTNPFEGWVEKGSLAADLSKTPLAEKERASPYAFAPLVEFLLAKKVSGAPALEDLGSHVREEAWGVRKYPGSPSQAISDLFVHQAGKGDAELWVKIEFQPWFTALGSLPDQDHDGFPEVYGKVKSEAVQAALVTAIQKDYGELELAPAEVKGWANQLASYWYPSFNTDLVPPGSVWPDERTEPEIKKELADRKFDAPTVVMRGKPHGKPTYNVFLVKSAAAGSGGSSPAKSARIDLPKSKPSPDVKPIRELVQRELNEQGKGSWEQWAANVKPLHDALRARLKRSPKNVKAFAGADGFLFFRNSIEYVVGGDLEQQPKGKNPLPIIVDFKNELAKLGVDFLFVPVPTKEEIFPEELEPKQKALAGQIINPYSRKFLLALANAGVEVVDLLPALLAARAEKGKDLEPLYQRQDTHWTDRGLRLAADALSTRVKRYGWYRELSQHAHSFSTRETTFTRFGDLHSRLPEAQRRGYKPETLKALQVIASNDAPYEDDADSPIVILGDSFTGVYELTDAEHAGVSAHVAKNISYPVDLVMSYGGGPNVRNKLMRRGAAELGRKKLVIWLMTARDLYNYWEDWQPLEGK